MVKGYVKLNTKKISIEFKLEKEIKKKRLQIQFESI